MTEIKSYGTRFGFLSGSTLKLIACVAMFFDHFGLMIYPNEVVFRAIGRLAFPIFAYFIAEGCRYTRNRFKHFMLVFGMGVFYLGIYYFVAATVYPSIFLTFSVSILIIYFSDALKRFVFKKPGACRISLAIMLFALALAVAYIPFSIVTFDYGYLGMLAPVLISLFDFKGADVPKILKRLDCYFVRLLTLSVICVLLAVKHNSWSISVFGFEISMQFCNLLSIPILALYNGKAGNKKLKYFFYIFYPAHIVVITPIALIIDFLK